MKRILAFAVISFFFNSPLRAEEAQPFGVVSALKNDVRAYRNPHDKVVPNSPHKQVKFEGKIYDDFPLAKQSPLHAGDVVVTLANSHVKLILLQGDVVILGPNSKFELNSARREKEGAPTRADNVHLLYGKIRSIIKKPADDKGARVQVRSPNAVVGVRGTDFYTEFDPLTKKTKVASLHGSVEVENTVLNISSPPKDKSVPPVTQKIVVEEGKESFIQSKKDQTTTPPTPPRLIQPTTISSAVFISTFKHDPSKDTAAATEPKISEQEFKKLEVAANENIASNTEHLKLEPGEDPLSASMKTYQNTLNKMYKSEKPINERVFNWMKNAL